MPNERTFRKLEESSQYWMQLFGLASLYRDNPEDASPYEYILHDVPAYTIPLEPAIDNAAVQERGSPGLGPPRPFSPPQLLWTTGTAEWRVDSTVPDLVNTEARSAVPVLLGMTSSCVEEAKLNNDFPARAPDITISCSNAEISQHLMTLGIGPQAAQDLLERARTLIAKDNHLMALTLGWTYILSALWAESQGGRISYINSTPQNRVVSVGSVAYPDLEIRQVVFVPGVDGDPVTWWRFLLAQPLGWEATIKHFQTTYHSPWAIRLPCDHPGFMVLSHTPPTTTDPPNSITALKYLVSYCNFHGLTDQAKTALAAALVIPSHTQAGWIRVNLPKPIHAVDVLSCAISSDNVPQDLSSPLFEYFPRLPYLMTISALGVTNLLLGALYNPEVPSTSCGEWCSPAARAWPDSTSHAAAIGCLRSPCLGRWWIGAGVTSLISPAMIRSECCMWHTDLQLAVWTGSAGPSPHSHFCRVLTEGVTLRYHTPAKQDNSATRLVLRADEVLAAFLTSATGPSASFSYIPPAPFHPPGYSELDKSSLQIIKVADANATLRLVPVKWIWNTRIDATKKHDMHKPELQSFYSSAAPHARHSDVVPEWEMPEIELLIPEAENNSENVTRSIMDWIIGRRGIEADEGRGDLDLEKLFAVYYD